MEPVHAAKRPELNSAARPRVSILTVVGQARRRLRTLRRASFVARHGARLFIAAAILTTLRPLVWPLATHEPLSRGPVRALIMLVIGVLTTGLVFIVATRRLPSPLAAARRLDIALGLDDIVASALSFATHDKTSSGFRGLTIKRAENTLRGLPLNAILPRPTSARPRQTMLSSAVLMLAALTIGSFDPAWVRLLQRPPTPEEEALVAALVRVADEANQAPSDPEAINEEDDASEDPRTRGGDGSEREDALETARRRANHAAELMARGNREDALRELSAVRSGDREASRRERELETALRDLARALQRTDRTGGEQGSRAGARRGGEQGGEPAGDGTASRLVRRAETRPASEVRESLRLLTKRLREPPRGSDTETKEEEQRRTLERLQRAAHAAGERAARPGATEAERAAAESLHRAAEALSRGERDAAADAITEAAQRAAELERQRREMRRAAEQMARLLERAGLLERAVRLAMLGRESQGERSGREGERRSGGRSGEGPSPESASAAANGSRSSALASLAARLAGFEQAESAGAASRRDEPHIFDRRNGRGSTASATRTSRDRVDVHEGRRAVQAIEGLGVDGEPTEAYRDVFPTYDAVIEDALENDHVPPARRDVVRRYFESIRPGAERSQ